MMPKNIVPEYLEPSLTVVARTLKAEWVRQECQLSEYAFGTNSYAPLVLCVSISVSDELIARAELRYDECLKKKMTSRASMKAIQRQSSAEWDNPLDDTHKKIQRQSSAKWDDPIDATPLTQAEYEDTIGEGDTNENIKPESGHEPGLTVNVDDSDDDEVDPRQISQCELIFMVMANLTATISGIVSGIYFMDTMRDKSLDDLGLEPAGAILGWNVFSRGAQGLYNWYSQSTFFPARRTSENDLEDPSTPGSRGAVYPISTSSLSKAADDYEPPKLG
jgi:hypothetical protein